MAKFKSSAVSAVSDLYEAPEAAPEAAPEHAASTKLHSEIAKLLKSFSAVDLKKALDQDLQAAALKSAVDTAAKILILRTTLNAEMDNCGLFLADLALSEIDQDLLGLGIPVAAEVEVGNRKKRPVEGKGTRTRSTKEQMAIQNQELLAFREVVFAALSTEPIGAGDLAERLSCPTAKVAGAMALLLSEQRVTKVGQKRATKYLLA